MSGNGDFTIIDGYVDLVHHAFLSSNLDGIELTLVVADPALDAEGLIEAVRFLVLSADRLLGTGPATDATARARLRINLVADQSLTDTGRTPFLLNVRLVFIQEIIEGRQHGVRGRLAKPAQGGVFDRAPTP